MPKRNDLFREASRSHSSRNFNHDVADVMLKNDDEMVIFWFYLVTIRTAGYFTVNALLEETSA